MDGGVLTEVNGATQKSAVWEFEVIHTHFIELAA
jgi:hypothetical protein